MSELQDQATKIIVEAYERLGDVGKVANYYSISPRITRAYLNGGFIGALTARYVIRKEIFRLTGK